MGLPERVEAWKEVRMLPADACPHAERAGHWRSLAALTYSASSSRRDGAQPRVDTTYGVQRGPDGEHGPPGPVVEKGFKGIAILLVVGGVVVAGLLLPWGMGGLQWNPFFFTPALTWFAGALLAACLLWAVADLLRYLHRIERRLRRSGERQQ